jgi:hypothetical protein
MRWRGPNLLLEEMAEMGAREMNCGRNIRESNGTADAALL